MSKIRVRKCTYCGMNHLKDSEACATAYATKPPHAVLALLSLADCEFEYVPLKWVKGARRKAYWRVWHKTNRLGVFVTKGDSSFERWRWVVSKILRSTGGNQTDQVRS